MFLGHCHEDSDNGKESPKFRKNVLHRKIGRKKIIEFYSTKGINEISTEKLYKLRLYFFNSENVLKFEYSFSQKINRNEFATIFASAILLKDSSFQILAY
jgi:hypothetical protein